MSAVVAQLPTARATSPLPLVFTKERASGGGRKS